MERKLGGEITCMENNVFEVDELEEMQLKLIKVLIKEANEVSIDFHNKSNLSKVFKSLENNIEIFNMENKKQESLQHSYI